MINNNYDTVQKQKKKKHKYKYNNITPLWKMNMYAILLQNLT